MRALFKSGLMSLILATLLLLALTATGAAQKTVIVHMHDVSHEPEWLEWLRAAKDRFEALHPDIEIQFLTETRPSLNEKLVVLWGAGEHPDVIEVLPSEHYYFALRGMFRDLRPYFEQDQDLDRNDFFPLAVEAATIIEGHPGSGQMWMMPASIWVTGAAVNDTHFAEAGLLPPSRLDHQWTWEEFAESGKKLTRIDGDGSISRYGVGLQTYIYWIRNAGGEIFDRMVDPTRTTVNAPPVYRALEFLQDAVVRSEYALRTTGLMDFATERISIFMHGGPSTTQFVRNSGADWEWSYAANPADVKGGSEIVTLGFAMSSQAKNPDATWQWMKFLVTEMAADHIAYTGRPGAWGPVAQDYFSYFQDPTEWEQVWIDLINHPDTYNRLVAAPEVVNTLNSYIGQVLDGQAAPEVVMSGAVDHLNAIIAANRLTR
jgi:ABC-type sugar transport system, periplasmic component